MPSRRQSIIGYKLLNFRLVTSDNPDNPALAFFDVAFGGGQVIIQDCKLMRRKADCTLFLSLPSRRRGDQWQELVRMDLRLKISICETARDLYDEMAVRLDFQPSKQEGASP